MKTLVTVAALLCMASVASANIWVEVDSGTTPLAGSTNLYGFTVRLVSDTFDNRACAWDGTFSGQMHQVWHVTSKSGILATPDGFGSETLDGDAPEWARDSHFVNGAFYLPCNPLFNGASEFAWLSAPKTPTETPYNTDGGGGNSADHEGTSLLLSAALAAPTPYQSANYVLAYIVIAADQTVTMTGHAANKDGVLFTTDVVLSVPEPGTMALIVMGMAALVVRRRRRTA